MMGEGNGVASVIMLTFTKMPGPHADTAWPVVGQLVAGLAKAVVGLF